MTPMAFLPLFYKGKRFFSLFLIFFKTSVDTTIYKWYISVAFDEEKQ